MCVIIHKPANGKLTLEQLEQCAARNKDGIGVAWFEKRGTIHVQKDCKVKDVYAIADEATYYDLFIHFRLATHGPKTAAMMHPFGISERAPKVLDPHLSKQVVFHNGIISGFGTAKLSDTAHFCQSVLARVDDLETRKALMSLTGDRFLYLHVGKDNRGRVERIGRWDQIDGTYFSNLNWKPYKRAESSKSGRVVVGGYCAETGKYEEWDFGGRYRSGSPKVVEASDPRIITGIVAPTAPVIPVNSDAVSDDPAVVNAAIESSIEADKIADKNRELAIRHAFRDSPLEIIQRAINLRNAELSTLDLTLPGHRLRKVSIQRALEILEDIRVERIITDARASGVVIRAAELSAEGTTEAEELERIENEREMDRLEADALRREQIEAEHREAVALRGWSHMGE